MNRKTALVSTVVVVSLSLSGYAFAATGGFSPHDGPRVIMAAGILPAMGDSGTLTIGLLYHFRVYHDARIVGNWTAGGLVQAGILNASQYQAKNFSAVYSRPFSNSGNFNAVLQPGEYWIEFNLGSNSNSTVVVVTTPIELVGV